MLSRPVSDRTKVAMVIQSQAGRRHTAEIEVLDDPRDPMARMFFVYDITEVQDLRELLVEKNQLQGLIGQSAPMQHLFQQIRNVASVDSDCPHRRRDRDRQGTCGAGNPCSEPAK